MVYLLIQWAAVGYVREDAHPCDFGGIAPVPVAGAGPSDDGDSRYGAADGYAHCEQPGYGRGESAVVLCHEVLGFLDCNGR